MGRGGPVPAHKVGVEAQMELGEQGQLHLRLAVVVLCEVRDRRTEALVMLREHVPVGGCVPVVEGHFEGLELDIGAGPDQLVHHGSTEVEAGVLAVADCV